MNPERRAPNAERQSDVPFEAIVSSMAEGVIAVDAKLRLQFINPAARTLLRLAVPDPSGRDLLELIRVPDLYELLQRVLATGQSETRELTVFGPTEQVLRAQAVTYRHDATHHGALVVLSDITEIRKLERLRRDFVANVSHELRTPVTAIQAALETLQSGAEQEPQERAKFLSKMTAQTGRLGRLIDDLMALSQVESGGLAFHFETVSLEPLVQELLSHWQAPAARQHVTLTLQLPRDLPPVRADREQLHQVMDNLLDNAIKFNRPSGTVTITATTAVQTVTIAVADTGIGIPPEDILRIFERFYRVEKGRARTTGGTGLGLAIVKHLVEAHHGTIRAESTPNRGSTFYVTLPRPS